jgi:hypothetical protein
MLNVKLFCYRVALTNRINGTGSILRGTRDQGPGPQPARNYLNFMEPEVHDHVRNSQPLDPIQSQINPVNALPSYFVKIHINVTALEAGRSRVRIPLVSLEFFIDTILPAAL